MKAEKDTVEKEDLEWMLGSNMIISYLHRCMYTRGVLICLSLCFEWHHFGSTGIDEHKEIYLSSDRGA